MCRNILNSSGESGLFHLVLILVEMSPISNMVLRTSFSYITLIVLRDVSSIFNVLKVFYCKILFYEIVSASIEMIIWSLIKVRYWNPLLLLFWSLSPFGSDLLSTVLSSQVPWYWVHIHLLLSLPNELILQSLYCSFFSSFNSLCVNVYFVWSLLSYACSFFLPVDMEYLFPFFQLHSVWVFFGEVCFF